MYPVRHACLQVVSSEITPHKSKKVSEEPFVLLNGTFITMQVFIQSGFSALAL